MPRWWLAAVVVLAAAAGASAKQPLNLTLPLVRAQCSTAWQRVALLVPAPGPSVAGSVTRKHAA